MSGIDAKHPQYDEYSPDWNVSDDVYKGERRIKEKGRVYLPATSGMIADGVDVINSDGYNAYQAYKTRAVFPDHVKESVQTALGVMHHKPPVIEVPTALEPMIENATTRGESLKVLMRRINEFQLFMGRCGLLLDLPAAENVEPRPYIAFYDGRDIINWDTGTAADLTIQNLNMVVLDESGPQRVDQFKWEDKKRYRVLLLGEIEENEGVESGAVYRFGVFNENTNFNEAAMEEASIRGNMLDKIPFTFVNAADVLPEPTEPPMLGMSKLALAIYRGEADYRQALFMQGQDTLVVSGSTEKDKKWRTGAGAVINLPLQGTAEFIGVDSTGLSEMRSALENDKAAANQKSGQMVNAMSRERESGDALKIRVAGQTATFNQIAEAGAFAVEQQLKLAAEWMGANPDEVKVEANLDFADEGLDGRTLVEYMTAKNMGAPWAMESIHNQLREKDLTTFEFDEELAKIEEEGTLFGNTGDGPVEDDPNEGQNQ